MSIKTFIDSKTTRSLVVARLKTHGINRKEYLRYCVMARSVGRGVRWHYPESKTATCDLKFIPSMLTWVKKLTSNNCSTSYIISVSLNIS
jgi:hypothetical protein